MEISVVIPAYNEQESIRPTVQQCHAALQKLFNQFEIIIVDDKSTDATGRIAGELSQKHSEVRVIHNERNLRQGASIILGFQQARYELVTHNAMDYPFHLEDLAHVLPMFANADVVVIARNQRPESTLYRRLLTAVNLFLLRNCFGLRLKDYNFVQVYRRTVLQRISFDCTSTGFLTPSILFQAHRHGDRIAEITLRYWARGQGKASSGRPKVLIETIRDMLRFWVAHRLGGK